MCEGLMDEGTAGPALCLHLSQDVSEEVAYLLTTCQLARRGHPIWTFHSVGEAEVKDAISDRILSCVLMLVFQLVW